MISQLHRFLSSAGRQGENRETLKKTLIHVMSGNMPIANQAP
jgi:hypothetical protein